MFRARIGVVALVFFLFALAVPAGALAQDTPDPITRVFTVKAKSGAAPQLETAIKEFVGWLGTQNGAWGVSTWQYLSGERTNQYVLRNQGHQWADFDGLEGSELSAAIQQKVAELKINDHVQSVVTSYERTLFDLSRFDANAEPFLARVIEYRLNPTSTRTFLRARRKMHEVSKKMTGGTDFVWIQRLSGGVTPSFSRVWLYDRWAALEPQGGLARFLQGMDEMYGREEAQAILDASADSIRGQRSNLARYRPDLSYVPAPMTTSQP